MMENMIFFILNTCKTTQTSSYNTISYFLSFFCMVVGDVFYLGIRLMIFHLFPLLSSLTVDHLIVEQEKIHTVFQNTVHQ
jgi:hypothetical protein